MLFEWTLFKNPELRHGKLYDCSNLKGHNSVIFDRFLNTLSSYDQETNIYTKATIHFNFGQFFSSPRVWPPPPHGPKKKTYSTLFTGYLKIYCFKNENLHPTLNRNISSWIWPSWLLTKGYGDTFLIKLDTYMV